MSDQGTGKHPHKSTEEPYPHHEGKSSEGSKSAQNTTSGTGGDGGKQSGDSSDLKEREYRDAQGNVHHHTRTYDEQHGKK